MDLTPRILILCVLLVTSGMTLATAPAAGVSEPLVLREFTIDPEVMEDIRNEWVDDLLATHPEGTWATMDFKPTDDQLFRMGLPPADVLTSLDLDRPTLVFPDGSYEVLEDLPSVDSIQTTTSAGTVSVAGAGWFGVRPGGWLLLLDGGIGWCSFAHVYGSPGSYSISTAGHCGATGDTATVIAGTGNRGGAAGVVLLNIGKFSKSTGDGGIGRDWALISVDAPWQKLVSPTMAFWGGPVGMYTKTGATVSAALFGGRKLIDGPYVNPDPFLVQGIVHYGHGTGVGAGGTPRAGTAFHWGATTMIWEGVISPGDSGSGSNTATGDAAGAQREAASINTHIFVDLSLKTGIGFMASTRVTSVSATLANGQLVPYPVPLPGAP